MPAPALKHGAHEAPQRFGPYRVERRIGSGSAGRVFEAIDDERGLRVALKALAELEPVAIQQLKNEFRSVASAEHRNLVRHYELMEADGSWFFTMELLCGSDLNTFLRAPVRTPDDVRRVFAQLAAGIATMHRHGLLHLDIKPANVFVEPDGRVVLLDFGVSGNSRRGQAVRTRHGTPRFMAPEQLRGEASVPASDWYAFGLLLFEALAGRSPRGDDPYEALDDPEHPHGIDDSALLPTVPQELRALCLALLHSDPAQRPTSAHVLRELGVEPLPPAEAATLQLVGRELPAAALDAALQRVTAGAAVIAHVVAESGGGKSALIAQFLERTRVAGNALVLMGRCYEWESVPYKGLDAAVDELSSYLRELGSQERRALEFASYDEVSALFPVLRRFVQPDAASTGRGDETGRRGQAFHAFRQLLRSLTRNRPIVCFIDDAHWSDADSARLLLEALSLPDPPRVLLILAYRPAEAERSGFLRELQRAVEAQPHSWLEQHLDLEPLSEAHSCRLAAELLGKTVDDPVCLEIAREARGNPFFVEELVRCGRGGQATTGSTLDEMLRSRVARLPEEIQRVLNVIAVAGRLAEQDLALLAGGAAGDPHRVLAALRAASLVRTSGPRRTDAVEPYHDRIRESVVRTLTPSELRSAHRALATTLQTRTDSDPYVLSVHFEGAGDRDTARGYAVTAAERAAAVLAFDRAAAGYERALALGATERELPWLLEERSRALFNAGRAAEAGPLFLRAAQHHGPAANRRLRRQAVESFLTAGKVREGVEALMPLCREAGLSYRPANANATLSVLVQLIRLAFLKVESRPPQVQRPRGEELEFAVDLCWAAGRGLSVIRPAQGLDLLLRGLILAAKLGEPRRLARSLTLQGSALVAMGDPLAALGARWLARAATLADDYDDPYLRGLTEVFAGFSEVAGAGRWPLAMASAERGMQILSEHCTGVAWERDMAMAVWLKAFEPSGDVRTLGVKAAEWARDAAARGDVYTQNVAASFIVPHRLAEGEVTAARRQARLALADWHDIGYTVQHYHATRLEACCDLYAGDAESAWRRFESELPKFKEIQLYRLSLSRIELMTLEAVIRLSLASGEGGKRHRSSAAKLARRLELEARSDGQPHAAMIRAVLDVLKADRSAGIVGLRRARELYARANMPVWSWAVARRLGELTRQQAEIAAADEWFQARGVCAPAQWVAQFVPGLPI